MKKDLIEKLRNGEIAVENEFQWGEEVWVRDTDSQDWIKDEYFVGKTKEGQFVTADLNTHNTSQWIYCTRAIKDEPKEMTLEQIQKELGYKIKIVQ